ncbi:cupin domain-containing protein [Skermania piniformis]|uniref:Cupin domain-containing protein n=1 Tax=Skermania pinensis TaxID=39122 RepID=A0ABX8SAC9_9ACTN|nr:cupin domain-containing protein [Skermania piniformis]QXQ14815.1 cupin domain-containing protein [Skermania piniformis]
MTGEHLKAEARVVLTGLDENGKSTFVSDANTTVRTAQPGFTVMELWQFDSLPANVLAPSTLGDNPVIDPPPAGLVVRLASFPPDSEYDAVAFKESLDAFGHDENDGNGSAELWHETDTIDVVTIIEGEIYAVTETGETLLKPGDTVVNRGVKHIWSNRSDKPCLLSATMMAGTR